MTSFEVGIFTICMLCVSFGVIIFGVIVVFEKHKSAILVAGLLSFILIGICGGAAYRNMVALEKTEAVMEVSE